MPRHDHLPPRARHAAANRNWTDVRVNELLVRFFRINPQYLMVPQFITDLDDFFEDEAHREMMAESIVIRSIKMEYASNGDMRVIVFETDHTGCSTVLDIAESDKLPWLKKFVTKTYQDVKHVYLGGTNDITREVKDPWTAALALMAPKGK